MKRGIEETERRRSKRKETRGYEERVRVRVGKRRIRRRDDRPSYFCCQMRG
jgi:hypothetical protein